jgi:hypothetical protein
MAPYLDASPGVQVTRPWWDSRLCLALIVLATMVPLLYPPVPPLVDLFGHIGRYRVELDLDHSRWLQQYYSLRWTGIGNLGVDLLVIPLGRLLGLEPAVKLIVLFIPPLTAVGFLWVSREVHGYVPPTAFFALPFIYGYPFLLGFLNFTLSVALSFIAFALWLRLVRTGRTVLRGSLFTLISMILFFCHAYGWALLGLMCFCAETVRLHENGRTWPRSGFGASLRTSMMALPLVLMLIWREGASGARTEHWFDLSAKLQWILSALRDRWEWFDIFSLAIGLVVIVEARRRPNLAFSRSLTMPVIALTALFFLSPVVIFGSAYADMRLVPYIIALAILAIRFAPNVERTGAKLIAAMGLAFFIVRIASTTTSLWLASDEQREELRAIDFMPQGARVATFVGVPCGFEWAAPRNTHLGAMVMARRDGLANDQWLIPGVTPVALKYKRVGAVAGDPSELVHPMGCTGGVAPWSVSEALAAVPRDGFDYVWLVDPPRFDERVTRRMHPIWRTSHGMLYRMGGDD